MPGQRLECFEWISSWTLHGMDIVTRLPELCWSWVISIQNLIMLCLTHCAAFVQWDSYVHLQVLVHGAFYLMHLISFTLKVYMENILWHYSMALLQIVIKTSTEMDSCMRNLNMQLFLLCSLPLPCLDTLDMQCSLSENPNMKIRLARKCLNYLLCQE